MDIETRKELFKRYAHIELEILYPETKGAKSLNVTISDFDTNSISYDVEARYCYCCYDPDYFYVSITELDIAMSEEQFREKKYQEYEYKQEQKRISEEKKKAEEAERQRQLRYERYIQLKKEFENEDQEIN